MKKKKPYAVLNRELKRIINPTIRIQVQNTLLEAPETFWAKPSSSSGHHHPLDEYTLGGLVLHTRRVCLVAETLIESFGLPPRKADIVRAACILHDICRYGPPKSLPCEQSRKDHPELAASMISNKAIAAAVRSHMGIWGITKPRTRIQWAVHLADVIASRDWFTIKPDIPIPKKKSKEEVPHVDYNNQRRSSYPK